MSTDEATKMIDKNFEKGYYWTTIKCPRCGEFHPDGLTTCSDGYEFNDDRPFGKIERVKKDPTNPGYYKGKVECIDALETATEGLLGIQAVCTANVIKYMWRWKQKNGIEDLKKAKWYLNRLISILEGAE